MLSFNEDRFFGNGRFFGRKMNFKLQNREVRFEVTNHCNAQCVFCPRDEWLHDRPQGVMDIGLYKRLIDELVEGNYGVDFISLENFGEPFIDPYLFDRARYVKEKGFYTATISTGSLLHKKKNNRNSLEQILECIDKLRFSYYGLTKEVYETLHKKLNFDVSTKNIHDLIEMKSKRGGITRIEMYFLLMPENKHQMEDWIKKYEPLVDGISVWKPHNWSDGRDYREMDHADKVTCGRPENGPLQIQWDGKIVPCCWDYNSQIVLGTVLESSIKDVYSGIEYESLREAHRNGEFYKYPFCDGCDQLNKKEDSLVYTSIADVKVGSVNTSYERLYEN